MISTPANLYKCDDCKKQRYGSDIKSGIMCSCGSGKVKYLEYSKLRFIKALLFDKEIRGLYWKENLKKGKLSVYTK